ncbi:sperm acrosome membrane-associated protein 4-like [Pundamilia nyererei]|uniref:Sperm acrosome membrane-associated protein 4-like n=1 Tax=Pundamilia nyererei TaxID=303518 RepID=A0A9Y3S2G5_9CICH|nr:PREDICTED: sperm acrosome membrane-associated protein 4-like [Pundamilia nyererei]XP_026013020.1 sperm acrosome membrane-associated protein 4-like isoform X1 [Astatotilapia calliptera]
MKTLLWSCAAVMTLFVTVESLTCETCDFKILGYCMHTDPVNCTGSQTNCFTGVAKFTISLLNIYERGCIEPAECRNETGSILYVNYTVTRTCCSTDLCNGATFIQPGFTAALCAALLAVWSQLGF